MICVRFAQRSVAALWRHFEPNSLNSAQSITVRARTSCTMILTIILRNNRPISFLVQRFKQRATSQSKNESKNARHRSFRFNQSRNFSALLRTISQLNWPSLVGS